MPIPRGHADCGHASKGGSTTSCQMATDRRITRMQHTIMIMLSMKKMFCVFSSSIPEDTPPKSLKPLVGVASLFPYFPVKIVSI